MQKKEEKKKEVTRDRGFFWLIENERMDRNPKNHINSLIMEQKQIYSSELHGIGNYLQGQTGSAKIWVRAGL